LNIRNLQNLPGEQGLREKYIPADGRVFLSIDYSQEELCALAQYCKLRFGHSRMYDLINLDLDLHGTFAAFRDHKLGKYDLEHLSTEDIAELKEILKWYKEDAENGKPRRKVSKSANFGLGGGMQALTFYLTLRNAGFKVTMDEVKQLIVDWYTFFPEVEELHNSLQADGTDTIIETAKKAEEDEDELEPEENEEVQQIMYDAQGNRINSPVKVVKLYRVTNALGMTKRRGGKCAVANYVFQSYAAVANKIAMWWVYYSEWERSKRLNVPKRFTINNFIHDELIFEVDKDAVKEVAETNSRLMVAAAKTVMPGINLKTEATAMTRWTKDEHSEYIIDLTA